MEIAGKSLRTRVLRALAVFAALLVYSLVTGSNDWVITLLVPPMFFLFSLITDTLLQNWLEGRE